MWFDSWDILARTVLVGAAAYATLIGILRLSGRRSLSQLNAFDFIVTVSLGSVLATILLDADVSWAEGVTALALLAGLQLVVALVSSRWPGSRLLFTAAPALLLADGQVHHEALRANRLTEDEVHQAIRMEGIGDISQVRAVVLETNGTLSVLTESQYGDGSAMTGVRDLRGQTR